MYSSHRIRTSVSSSLLGLLLLLLSASVPIAAQRAPNATTILSVANGAGLKQLVKAIEAVGGPLLEAVSNSSTAVTVFAPTDEAFTAALQALKITNLADLAANGLLQSILNFHIVARPIPSIAATTKGVEVPTLLTGQSLKLFKKRSGIFKRKKSESVYVKGYKTTAKVLLPDVPAGSSIVHVIDAVLVPQLA